MPLVKEVLRRMRELGIGEVPMVVDIISPEDTKELRAAGVARLQAQGLRGPGHHARSGRRHGGGI